MSGRQPRRPVGQPTRGKTARNRLRRTDTYLALRHAGLLRRMRAPYVDLGYGAVPETTVETFERLSRTCPGLRVVGVEIDAERVAAARASARPGLEFVRGGFELGLRAGVVRAMNVLRQYDEEQYAPAVTLMLAALEPGGVLLEGTCDPTGRVMAFNIWSAEGRLERVVFAAAPRHLDSPRDLQPVLPKNFVHHAEPGGAWDRFFATWELAWRTHDREWGACATSLAESGYSVALRPALLRRGFLELAELPT